MEIDYRLVHSRAKNILIHANQIAYTIQRSGHRIQTNTRSRKTRGTDRKRQRWIAAGMTSKHACVGVCECMTTDNDSVLHTVLRNSSHRTFNGYRKIMATHTHAHKHFTFCHPDQQRQNVIVRAYSSESQTFYISLIL